MEPDTDDAARYVAFVLMAGAFFVLYFLFSGV